MKKRLFAFGCSYTLYCYPTWADFIGINFDEHYNYGRSGASNTYIMNKVIEANEQFKFNSATDLVVVMLTGFGRFSYMNNGQWITDGDLLSNFAHTKNPNIGKLIDVMWSEEWIVYQSWIAAKTIKSVLTLNNIPHKILMGIDNKEYGNTSNSVQVAQVQDIYNILDFKKTLDEWRTDSAENNDSPIWQDTKRPDGHPSMRSHLKFAQDHFPELITNQSKEMLDQSEIEFDYSKLENQSNKFYQTFRKQHDKGYLNPLFGYPK
jgi:hypothetical protein